VRFKPALVDQAGLTAGHRVLDLGCGTGTLAILASQRVGGCEVVGLDADPQILALARRKAEANGLRLRFDNALSTALPYGDESFDRILSTLFFHHLDAADKRATLAEAVRVLRPGGELHIADWTAPADALQRALSWQVRLFDGVARTRENFRGELPRLLSAAGFSDVRERQRLRTGFGTLGLISATAA
jgi:ubiquinone/menaquinone biosynthesis C-methylase UbiE